MKKQFFTFFFIFLFGCLISCNNDPVVHSVTKTEKNTSSAESNKIDDTKTQKLSSILNELAVSPKPDDFAKKHHIFLDENRVRVYIFFEPSTSDSYRKKTLNDHEITIEKSAANMIRGLVPVDHLMSLSQEPVIRSIRLPDRLIKAKEINP